MLLHQNESRYNEITLEHFMLEMKILVYIFREE